MTGNVEDVEDVEDVEVKSLCRNVEVLSWMWAPTSGSLALAVICPSLRQNAIKEALAGNLCRKKT